MLKRADRILQVAELTHPFQAIATGQGHLGVDGVLCLENGAAQIAAAHAELDRHIALLLLAIDEGSARYQAHVGQILERHLNEAVAGARRRGHRNSLDGLEVASIGRTQAHHHRKMPVAGALVEIARALAADRRLHDGIDVAGRQSIARGPDPIDVDADRGLPERTQHGQIRDARNLGEHLRDVVRGLLQGLEVIAVDLDGILALHARCGLFDVVLDVLREIEVHAGKLLLQRLRHVLGELFLVDPARPGVEGLQRHEELGVEEARGIGAVVRSAMLGHDVPDFGVLARSRPACG